MHVLPEESCMSPFLPDTQTRVLPYTYGTLTSVLLSHYDSKSSSGLHCQNVIPTYCCRVTFLTVTTLCRSLATAELLCLSGTSSQCHPWEPPQTQRKGLLLLYECWEKSSSTLFRLDGLIWELLPKSRMCWAERAPTLVYQYVGLVSLKEKLQLWALLS